MSVTLHLGDCLEYMRTMDDGSIQAVITDPPYGIGAGRMKMGLWRTSRMPKSDWDKQPADVAPLLALNVPTVIWGGNYFDLPRSRVWRLWLILVTLAIQMLLAACQPQGTVAPHFADHTLEARPGEWAHWGDRGRL